MAKVSLPRPKKRSRKSLEVLRNLPGHGLVVSTTAAYPHSIDDKIVCAKSIVQAVLAAHDGAQDLGNYDLGWPLRVAVELLEQAADQVGKEPQP